MIYEDTAIEIDVITIDMNIRETITSALLFYQ